MFNPRRFFAPYILALSSILPLAGCPEKIKVPHQYKPPVSITQPDKPRQVDTPTDSGEPTSQDTRTVYTNRRIRTGDGNVFELTLRVDGPERVGRKEKGIYTVTIDRLSSKYIAVGGAADLRDVAFFPEGRGFKRLPPAGEYVAVDGARYPFDEFAKLLPGYEEARKKNLEDLKIISGIGRQITEAEIIPNLPSWYSDQAFSQSDFHLFTIQGSTGFDGVRQEIVCSAENDSDLKVFAFVKPWGSQEKILLSTDFPIDVLEDNRPKEGPNVSTIIGKEARLEYMGLAMSPTGDKVAFIADEKGTRRGVLGVTDLDGSNINILQYGSGSTLLALSPDDRIIHNRLGKIWLVDMDRETNGRISDKYPTGFPKSLVWSPGNRILYSQYLSVGERKLQEDIFSMDPETGEAVNLTSTKDLNETNPLWSPNGERIVFVSTNELVVDGGIQELVDISVMNKDGSQRISLTDTPSVKERLGGWIQDDVWCIIPSDNLRREVLRINMNGESISFYRDRDYFGADSPFVLPPAMVINGKSLQDRSFALSRDGRRLVFTAATEPSTPTSGRYDKDLYFFDLQAKKLTRVTSGKIIEEVVATPDLDQVVCNVVYRNGQTLEGFSLRGSVEPDIGSEKIYRGKDGLADVEVSVGKNYTIVRIHREEGGRSVEFLGRDEGSDGKYEKMTINENDQTTTISGNSDIVSFVEEKLNNAKAGVMGK